MRTRKTNRWGVLATVLALAAPGVGAGTIATGVVVGGALLLSSSTVEAQTAWGVSRRTARRTTRRTAARQEAIYHGGVATPYLGVLPPGYRTTVVGGVTYYEAGGTRYQATMVEGRTVYVEVH